MRQRISASETKRNMIMKHKIFRLRCLNGVATPNIDIRQSSTFLGLKTWSRCRSNVVAGPALNSSSQSFYFWTLTRVMYIYIITFRLISFIADLQQKDCDEDQMPGAWAHPAFVWWLVQQSRPPWVIEPQGCEFALSLIRFLLFRSFALCSFALSLKITHFKEQLLAIGSHCILQKSECEWFAHVTLYERANHSCCSLKKSNVSDSLLIRANRSQKTIESLDKPMYHVTLSSMYCK